jgi:hypothetical protein
MEENVGQRQPGLGDGLVAEKLAQLLAGNWHYLIVAGIFLGLMFVVARRRARAFREAPAAI